MVPDASIDGSDPRPNAIARWVFLAAILAYLCLFGINSLTRLRRFSPDSMNYVDVARNLSAGRGIVQSTLGFNQPHFLVDGTIPTPMTSQPPVYPLLIASVNCFGLSHADAALLIPVLCYGLVLLLAFLLARELYDWHVALASVACLLPYHPLRWVSSFAWSESVGMTFALLSCWLLARTRRTLSERVWMPFAAGLASGIAFSTRYAFFPLVFLGILLLVEPQSRRWTVRNLALYFAGFVLIAGWVIGRNIVLSGSWIGPVRNPSLRGLGRNLLDTVNATFQGYLAQIPPPVQGASLALSLVVVSIVLGSQRRLGETLEEVLLRGKRYLLPFWSFGYLFLLIYQRTQTHFDRIAPRLIVPAGVTLVILVCALLVRATRAQARFLIYPALLLSFLAIRDEARAMAATSPYNREQVLARSERLNWIAQHTTDRDLIIGDDTMDVPFYFDRTGAVSFSPFPYTDHPEYAGIMAYAGKHRQEYDRVYLVLRNRYTREESWRRAYGPFIADIVYRGTENYPGILYHRRLGDGHVFEIRPE